MIYAGGLKYILLSAVLFAPGTVLYFWARREQGKAVFDKTSDWVIFGVIVVAGASTASTASRPAPSPSRPPRSSA